MNERVSNEEIHSLLARDGIIGEDCGCLNCHVCRDLLDARQRIAHLEADKLGHAPEEARKVVDLAVSVVDGLDDPPTGLTWDGEPQTTCAAELEKPRSRLVPVVDAFLAARAAGD